MASRASAACSPTRIEAASRRSSSSTCSTCSADVRSTECSSRPAATTWHPSPHRGGLTCCAIAERDRSRPSSTGRSPRSRHAAQRRRWSSWPTCHGSNRATSLPCSPPSATTTSSSCTITWGTIPTRSPSPLPRRWPLASVAPTASPPTVRPHARQACARSCSTAIALRSMSTLPGPITSSSRRRHW